MTHAAMADAASRVPTPILLNPDLIQTGSSPAHRSGTANNSRFDWTLSPLRSTSRSGAHLWLESGARELGGGWSQLNKSRDGEKLPHFWYRGPTFYCLEHHVGVVGSLVSASHPAASGPDRLRHQTISVRMRSLLDSYDCYSSRCRSSSAAAGPEERGKEIPLPKKVTDLYPTKQ